MNLKTILALFGLMLFGAGIVMAIGVNPTDVNALPRWVQPNATTNITTEGGNITAANLNGTTLTDRWAAFFGNTSGVIVLQDNAGTPNVVYSWSWTAANGGKVCLSTNTAYPFADAAKTVAADVAAVDTAYGLGAVADNATNTLTNSSCDLQFNDVANITGTAETTTGGGFHTCLVKDTATTAETDFAFCTNINSTGTAFNTNPADFQVMVPTTPYFGSTEDYFFYMELD